MTKFLEKKLFFYKFSLAMSKKNSNFAANLCVCARIYANVILKSTIKFYNNEYLLQMA